MPYTKTQWKNGEAPAINETNLNKIEDAIESVTNTAESAASDLATLSGEVAQNTSDIADLNGKATAVSVNPILTNGTKIAEITVDGDKKNLYAPSGGGGGGGASDWSELTGKPFEDISADDFTVDSDGVLHVIGGGGGDVPQTVVIPYTLQAGDTTCTITSSKIKSDSILQPMIWAEDGEEPKEFSVTKMVVRNGSCTLTFKSVSVVTQIGLAILGEAVEGGEVMESATVGSSKVFKFGGLVFMCLVRADASNFVLPEGFRPQSQRSVGGLYSYSSATSTYMVDCDVTTSGKVNFFYRNSVSARTSLASGNVYGSAFFFLND